MAYVDKKVLIEHSAEQMFALVDCCEDYPKFLPWCSASEVKQRDGAKTVATLHLNYRGVESSFTTENDKVYPSHIHLRLMNGPFKHLTGDWRFTSLTEAACKVEFQLEYEFSSKLLEKLIGPVFSYITNSFVDAFVKRADHMKGIKTP